MSRWSHAAVLHLIAILGIDIEELLRLVRARTAIVLLLIIFAETGLLIGFFLPGDSLLFTAGLFAGQGQARTSRWSSSAASSPRSSATRSATPSARRSGRRLFRRPDSKLFKQEYVERTDEFFETHGPKTIVLARFVPVVRTFAPILAGVG